MGFFFPFQAGIAEVIGFSRAPLKLAAMEQPHSPVFLCPCFLHGLHV
jgi:hypothetical protein